MNALSLQEIERLYDPGIGRHWFDVDTMRFFKCRLAEVGYQREDGAVFFVSSEKGPSVRAYTVRKLTGPKGSIETVGEFQAYGNGRTADRAARAYAEGREEPTK